MGTRKGALFMDENYARTIGKQSTKVLRWHRPQAILPSGTLQKAEQPIQSKMSAGSFAANGTDSAGDQQRESRSEAPGQRGVFLMKSRLRARLLTNGKLMALVRPLQGLGESADGSCRATALR